MSAVVPTPLVKVPVGELDDTWVGEKLLVTHSVLGVCSRTWGRPEPQGRDRRNPRRCVHFGGLSEISRLPASAVLFIGGEQVLVTPADVVVAAPTPTALDHEDLTASPYDA